MKNFDWLQAFAMEQQEQPEPGVSADAAPPGRAVHLPVFGLRPCISGPPERADGRMREMRQHE